MITSARHKVAAEFAHFSTLSLNARDLIKSFTAFEVVSVISAVFSSAYIWSKVGSDNAVAFYYLINLSIIPLIFYLNGLLMKRVGITRLFAFGTLLYGLGPLVLVALPQINYFTLAVAGVVLGTGIGFYWANRNYLTIDATTDDDRNYFFGLSFFVLSFASIVSPAIAGYYLNALQTYFGVTPATAYISLMALGAGFAVLSIYILRDNTFHNPHISRLFPNRVDRHWNLLRAFTVFQSFRFSLLLFIPALLVLNLIGSERELGVVETVVALLAAFASYFLGKRLSKKQRLALFTMGLVLIVLSSGLFVTFYSSAAALLFISGSRLAAPLRGNATMAIWFREIERLAGPKGENYMYICDIELFIAIGRISAILIYLALSQVLDVEQTLVFSIAITAVVEFGVWALAYLVERRQPTSAAVHLVEALPA